MKDTLASEVDFRLKLLLSSLRITCRYFKDDNEICELSEEYAPEQPADDESDWHRAYNCGGDINKCDLPDKFRDLL